MLLAGAWLVGSLCLPASARQPARAPHNGQVVAAGPYRLELVAAGYPGFHLYLFDSRMAPVSAAAASGKAVVELDGRKRVVDLIRLGKNHLHGLVDLKKVSRYAVIVNVNIRGRTYTARFTHSRRSGATRPQGAARKG